MAFDSKGLDDYIDVAQRIAEFRVKHPEGSLQPLNPAQPFEIREMAGTDKNGKEVRGTFIIYAAAAYRSPDDQRPGVGCAYEVFPGRTPYTAGSELQNAETAAWGRAIVAALAADTRAGIASQQEVRNRNAERDSAADAFENATPAPARRNGNGQPSPEWSKWLAGAVEMAPKHTSLDACRAAWKRSAELITEGKLNQAQVTPLRALLTKRMEELKATGGKAPVLAPDDPWRDTVEGLSDVTEAETVLTDAETQLRDGTIDAARFEQIETAVKARFPDAGVAGQVAA